MYVGAKIVNTIIIELAVSAYQRVMTHCAKTTINAENPLLMAFTNVLSVITTKIATGEPMAKVSVTILLVYVKTNASLEVL
jgi:hypothetical protein